VIAVLACLALAAAVPLIVLVAFLRWVGFSLI
jgi:hypothetical protein